CYGETQDGRASNNQDETQQGPVVHISFFPSETWSGHGFTVKVATLTAVPRAVVTEIGPVPTAAGGTRAAKVVFDMLENGSTWAMCPLNSTRLPIAVRLNPLPAMSTRSPAFPDVGVKFVITGAPQSTRK